MVPAVLLALLPSGGVAMAAEPSGTITWGVHVTLANRWLDTADTDAEITPFMVMYALHDALVKPMPAGPTAPSTRSARGFVGATGAAGNASTRIEPYATGKGVNSYGTIPEIESLFQRQLVEMDRRKREDLLFQTQRLIAERVLFVPIWENGFIRAYGPRVEEPGRTRSRTCA